MSNDLEFEDIQQLLVAIHFRELNKLDRIVQVGFDRGNIIKGRFKLAALTHQFLRFLRLIPKIRILRKGVQFRKASLGCFPVKDASVAGGVFFQ